MKWLVKGKQFYMSHTICLQYRIYVTSNDLKKGKVEFDGPSTSAVERYIEASFDFNSEIEGSNRFEDANKTEDVKLISVKLYQGKNKQNTSIINISETSKIEIVYEVLRDGLVLHPNIHVHDTMGTPILSSGDLPGFSGNNEKTYSNKPHKPGVYVSECELPAYFFNDKIYSISVILPIARHFALHLLMQSGLKVPMMVQCERTLW